MTREQIRALWADRKTGAVILAAFAVAYVIICILGA